MSRRVRWRLLCEDRAQENLLRPILERMFGSPGYVEPRNATGGVTFVLNSFRKCMKVVRRTPQEAVGLVVVLDGDDIGQRQRITQLETALGERWDSREHVATCVPTRTVETWEYWLCGERIVDESTDYKDAFRREVDRGTMTPKRAATAWFAQLSDADRKLESDRVPSLAAGRKELANLRAKTQKD